MRKVKADKQGVLMLSDDEGKPVACVVRVEGHLVFYSLKEMGEDEIQDLFSAAKESI